MISIIIPSHNRKAILGRVLDTLAHQSVPTDQFEVVVVLDGCTDGSGDALRETHLPFALQIIEQSPSGASAARNNGAKQAQGELLIFLDDDIEATPDFIQAHLTAHQQNTLPKLVVIGHSPPLRGHTSFLSLQIQGWWEAMFRRMRQPGYRFQFTDMLSGNFSISKDVFLALGGFDLGFAVHEDYEFGMRFIRAGGAFVFEPKAVGIHHEKTDMMRPLVRKYHEGIADIALGRLYPELVPNLIITRLLNYALLPSRILRLLQFKAPKIAAWVATIAFNMLPFLEKVRMLGLWRKTLDGLLGYWYWKGVSEELHTLEEVNQFVFGNLHAPPFIQPVEIDLDLTLGMAHVEQILDNTRPDAVKINLGQICLGSIPAEAGAEKLRGAHLRPLLVWQWLNYFVDKPDAPAPKLSHPPSNLKDIETIIASAPKKYNPLGEAKP